MASQRTFSDCSNVLLLPDKRSPRLEWLAGGSQLCLDDADRFSGDESSYVLDGFDRSRPSLHNPDAA